MLIFYRELLPAMRHTEASSDENAGLVDLCHGRTRDGRQFHAFIEMDASSYERYHRAISGGEAVDLTSFGKIIHAGWGRDPDPATVQRIMREHTDNFRILEAALCDAEAAGKVATDNDREGKAA